MARAWCAWCAYTIIFAYGCPALGEDFGDLRNLDPSGTKTRFAPVFYRTLDEWQERKEKLRRQILVSAGIWPLARDRGPVPVRRFGRLEHSTYSVEKIVFEPFAGLYVAANLYLPKSSGKVPGILVPHGHWKNGRVHHQGDYSVPALCINLAMQGYAALAYDMVGYNDTRQLKHDFGRTPEERLWSFTPLGVQLRNSIRALDLLESLPEVDPERLAVTGASGGGTQTILLAAVDDRIKVSIPVDMVSATFQGDDACEMAPGLRIGTNNVEISAMAAPRPMLLVSATGDWTRGTPNQELPAVRAIYGLYGREDLIRNAHIVSKHNYNGHSRAAVYSFLNDFLRREPLRASALREQPADLDPKKLLIGEPLCQECAPVFEAWRAEIRRELAELTPEQSRELLESMLGVEWPAGVSAIRYGRAMLLEREGSGERVPARWQPGASGEVTVMVDTQGLDHGVRPAAESLLILNPFQTGLAAADRRHHNDFLTFHRSDDQNRVQDIVTGLAFVAASSPQNIRLVCDSRSALWCLTAVAVSRVPVHYAVPEPARAAADLVHSLFIPGLERAGGLEAVRRFALNRVPWREGHEVSSSDSRGGVKPQRPE